MNIQFDYGMDWNLQKETFLSLLSKKQRQYVEIFCEHYIPENEYVWDVVISLSSNKKQLTFLLHKIYSATKTVKRSGSETFFRLSESTATVSRETYTYADSGNLDDHYTTVLYRNPLRWPSLNDTRALLLRYMV